MNRRFISIIIPAIVAVIILIRYEVHALVGFTITMAVFGLSMIIYSIYNDSKRNKLLNDLGDPYLFLKSIEQERKLLKKSSLYLDLSEMHAYMLMGKF